MPGSDDRQLTDVDATIVLSLVLTAVIAAVIASVITSSFTVKPSPPPQPTDSQILHSIIKERRSVFPKDYTGEPVPKEVLDRCFDAANWAPTHGKTEPWRFVVFSGSSGVDRFLELKKTGIRNYFADDSENLEMQLSKASKKEKELRNCAHIVIICVKRVTNIKGKLMPRWEEAAATACAVQNFHLALHSEGVGGYWSSGGVGTWLDLPEVRTVLGQDGEVNGEPDEVIGTFFIGGVEAAKVSKIKSRRGAAKEKVTYINA
jgi:hypothetical protein